MYVGKIYWLTIIHQFNNLLGIIFFLYRYYNIKDTYIIHNQRIKLLSKIEPISDVRV